MISNEELAHLVADTFKIDYHCVKPKTNLFQELGADSLELLSFITMLEKKYNLKVPDDVIEDFYCVENIFNFIKRNHNQEGSASLAF